MEMNMYRLQQYLDQMYQYVLHQNQRIDDLEQTLRSLKKEMAELKDRPYTNIEKVEYKFDQLKVETLEGVLNIGLNPTDTEAIDSFDVQQKGLHVNDVHKEIKNQIQQQCQMNMMNYLEEECPNTLKKISERYEIALEPMYEQLIIEDIKKQVDSRISYYMQGLRLHDQVNVQQQVEFIDQKVKHDIEQSIQHFIKNIPDEMKGDE